jgi:NAD(P)-dependent dehydrogenase (short-subunit alcohol dehydrogenase family)
VSAGASERRREQGPRSKVVVVTGGSRGIGRGLARELAQRGAEVVICGRDRATVEGTAWELGVVGVPADVCHEPDVQRVWDTAVERFGRVDVWINNAGISAPRKPFHELPLATARDVVCTNLLGAMTGSAVAVRGFLGQGHGQLWNMEGFGSNGMKTPGLATYGASKRAVTYFTEALRKDLKGTSVQVGLLSPGIVATDLLVRDYDDDPEGFEKARKVFNILGDRVETVTPWLADRVLATDRSGAHVQWLTRRKAFWRFATAFRKRDVFAA